MFAVFIFTLLRQLFKEIEAAIIERNKSEEKCIAAQELANQLMKTQEEKFKDVERKSNDLTLSQRMEAEFQKQLKDAMIQEEMKQRNVKFSRFYMKQIADAKTFLEKMHAQMIQGKFLVHNQFVQANILIPSIQNSIADYEMKTYQIECQIKLLESEHANVQKNYLVSINDAKVKKQLKMDQANEINATICSIDLAKAELKNKKAIQDQDYEELKKEYVEANKAFLKSIWEKAGMHAALVAQQFFLKFIENGRAQLDSSRREHALRHKNLQKLVESKSTEYQIFSYKSRAALDQLQLEIHNLESSLENIASRSRDLERINKVKLTHCLDHNDRISKKLHEQCNHAFEDWDSLRKNGNVQNREIERLEDKFAVMKKTYIDQEANFFEVEKAGKKEMARMQSLQTVLLERIQQRNELKRQIHETMEQTISSYCDRKEFDRSRALLEQNIDVLVNKNSMLCAELVSLEFNAYRKRKYAISRSSFADLSGISIGVNTEPLKATAIVYFLRVSFLSKVDISFGDSEGSALKIHHRSLFADIPSSSRNMSAKDGRRPFSSEGIKSEDSEVTQNHSRMSFSVWETQTKNVCETFSKSHTSRLHQPLRDAQAFSLAFGNNASSINASFEENNTLNPNTGHSFSQVSENDFVHHFNDLRDSRRLSPTKRILTPKIFQNGLQPIHAEFVSFFTKNPSPLGKASALHAIDFVSQNDFAQTERKNTVLVSMSDTQVMKTSRLKKAESPSKSRRFCSTAKPDSKTIASAEFQSPSVFVPSSPLSARKKELMLNFSATKPKVESARPIASAPAISARNQLGTNIPTHANEVPLFIKRRLAHIQKSVQD